MILFYFTCCRRFLVQLSLPSTALCLCKRTHTPPYCDGTHDSPPVLRQYTVQLLQANSRLQADILAVQAQQDQHKQVAMAACAVAVVSLLVAARSRWL